MREKISWIGLSLIVGVGLGLTVSELRNPSGRIAHICVYSDCAGEKENALGVLYLDCVESDRLKKTGNTLCSNRIGVKVVPGLKFTDAEKRTGNRINTVKAVE